MNFGKEYASFYDANYAARDYAKEAREIFDVMAMKPGDTVLELGCGAGHHARELVELGLEVHGIDSSQNMIDKCLPLFRAAFEVGDIRTWRRNELFDHVVAIFHVMSYQVDNDDLIKAFETAGRHLKPGGRFFFDFWNGAEVLRGVPGVQAKCINGTHRLCEPFWYPDENCFELKMTLTEGEKTAVEHHRMRYLFIPEIRLMLGNAGFSGFTFNIRGWSGSVLATK